MLGFCDFCGHANTTLKKLTNWWVEFIDQELHSIYEFHKLLILIQPQIQKYYKFKEENKKKIYDGLTPSGTRLAMEQGAVIMLPEHNQLGGRIILTRASNVLLFLSLIHDNDVEHSRHHVFLTDRKLEAKTMSVD